MEFYRKGGQSWSRICEAYWNPDGRISPVIFPYWNYN